MNETEKCEKIKTSFLEIEKEVKGHGIAKLLLDEKKKLEEMKNRGENRYSMDFQFTILKIDELEQFMRVYEELEKAYKIACNYIKGEVSCNILKESNDVWRKEIYKYRKYINFFGRKKYYEKVQENAHETFEYFCGE